MDTHRPRSSSRTRAISRPTTPLRPGSRSSVREAYGYDTSVKDVPYTQPAINALEPLFADLADRMADLETNFDRLQLMHESLTRFSESFASFLYGLNMNAFCVDFPEAPIAESFRRAKQAESQQEIEEELDKPNDVDATYMTSDTTFVENPPSTMSTKPTPRTGSTRGRGRGTSTRGSTTSRYATRGRARPSALPRGRSMR
ncbi:DASH complex subunit Dam1-domain-containing protein [Aspergillus unguis]